MMALMCLLQLLNNLAEEAKLAREGVKAPSYVVLSICKSLFAGGVAGGVHAKVKLIPNQQRRDENLTTYSRTLSTEGPFATKTKKWLESKDSRKKALLVIVLLGTCMMIGDGILTPAISG